MQNCFQLDSCLFSSSKLRQFQKFLWNYDLDMELYYDYDNDNLCARIRSIYGNFDNFVMQEGEYLLCNYSEERAASGEPQFFYMIASADQFTL